MRNLLVKFRTDKLENKIKEGIFAGKKLYCIIDYNINNY